MEDDQSGRQEDEGSLHDEGKAPGDNEPAPESRTREAFEHVVEKVQELAPVIADKLQEGAEIVVRKVREVAPEVGRGVQQGAGVVAKKVHEVAPVVGEKVLEGAVTLSHKVQEATPVVEKAVSTGLGKAGEALDDLRKGVAERMESRAKSSKDGTNGDGQPEGHASGDSDTTGNAGDPFDPPGPTDGRGGSE